MAKIAFVQNLMFEYLGTMHMSSVLRNKNHTVEVFVDNNQKPLRLIDQLKKFNPSIVGFYTVTGPHRWAIAMAGLIKSHMLGVKIIFGGPHATFFPLVVDEAAVDMVCRGEGEYALLEIADAFDAGKGYRHISNLWTKEDGKVFKNEVRPLIRDLDELPFPDRRLYYDKYPALNGSQKTIIVGRGCPFSCSYCFNSSLRELYKGKGAYVRLRSVDNCITELANIKESLKPKIIYIQDDTFAFDRAWTEGFLKIYKEKIALPFICLVRVDLVDEDIVKMLKDAGCKNVFFGIESGSENTREFLLKKHVTDEQIIKTASLLKKSGIGFRAYNMLGLPGETIEDVFRTVELNIKIRTDYPWSSLLQPFPGTELGEYIKKQGFACADINNFENSFFKKSGIILADNVAIENMHKLFFFAVKFPFLFPLIKKIINKNVALIYDFLFLLGYLFSSKESEGRSWAETIRVGLTNSRSIFFNKSNSKIV